MFKQKNFSLMLVLALVVAVFAAPVLADDIDGEAMKKATAEKIDKEISKTNKDIQKLVKKATKKLQNSKKEREMDKIAKDTEKEVFRLVDKLIEKYPSVTFTPFYITVCSKKIEYCVTFDPPTLIG